jgi:hypothetical protein
MPGSELPAYLLSPPGRYGLAERFALTPLLVKLFETMGGYKGRTNVKHRKRRSAKAERIKAISAKKEDTKKTA